MRRKLWEKFKGTGLPMRTAVARASTEDIYTKINKKTGACYSVKLCNPSTQQ